MRLADYGSRSMEKKDSGKRKSDTNKTICNEENQNPKKNSSNKMSQKKNSNVENQTGNNSSNKENKKKSNKAESQDTKNNSSNKVNQKKSNKAENQPGNNSSNKANQKKSNSAENQPGKNNSKNKNISSDSPAGQEDTQQPQKHWTQLYREYRLQRLGIYEEKKSYREIPKKIDLPLNGCGFGDEHFLFAGPDGSPKYEDINAPWDEFINWMEKVCKRYKKYKDTTRKGEYILGQELIVHASKRNIHTIYCYMSLNWPGFKDGFLIQKDCPETVIEFVRGIMANKMTEKQMWGTVDDRCPGGTVIVFDEAFMPKEGEDTGTIKFEYRPNFIQERMEKMKRSNGMI